MVILWILLLIACAYHWATWRLVERFRLHELQREAPFRPDYPVSHLKPIFGLQASSESCWRSFIDQPYRGASEVILTAGRLADPAAQLAHSLAGSDPRVKVIEGDVSRMGSNLKVGNLIQGYPYCTYPFILCSDSDIAAPPDYMDKVMALFEDPQVGVVTSLYAIRRVSSRPVALESLAIMDFSASVLVARALEGMSFGLGATLAFRREALQSIGAFEPLVDYLAEDFQLGNRIAKAGWKVKLSGVVVEDVVHSMTFSEFVSHQLRWMRSYRISRPAGHFAFIVTQGTLWCSLICLIHGWHWSSLLALAVWWPIRFFCAGRNWNVLSSIDLRAWWGCLIFKDYLYLVLWVVSWVGNRVRWGSRKLELLPGGKMRVV